MSARFPKKFAILLSVIVSQTTLLFSFGYESSIMLLNATTVMAEDLKLTESQLAHFTNDAKWVLLLACVVSGYLADFLGRRTTIIISGYVSCVGFTLMASSRSYGLLIAGRVVSLAGLGVGLPVTPLYIGEVASPRHRGFLNTIPEIFSVLGLWMAVVVRAAVSGVSPSQQWRRMIGAGAVPPILMAMGMSFLPESPCWLIRQGRVADTRAALEWTLKTAPEVNERLSALRSAARVPPTASDGVETVVVPPNGHLRAMWREVIRPHSLVTTLAKSIISILFLHLMQQSTGIELLTSDAMGKFIVPSSAAPLEFVSAMAPFLCGRLFPIFLPLFLSDVTKRETFLFVSSVLTIISLLIVNVSLVLSRHDDVDPMHPTFLVGMNKWAMVVFFGTFSVGLGPVTWIHTSEMLPYRVRAQVIGVVVMINRLVSFCLTYLKPLVDHIPNLVAKGILYWILNVLVIVGTTKFGRFFIESKGQSLEALDELPSGSTIELT